MKIEIIGKFYDNHSLSIINRNLAIGLNKKHDILITPLDAVNPDAGVKKEHLEILDELSSKEVKLGEEAELQNITAPNAPLGFAALTLTRFEHR